MKRGTFAISWGPWGGAYVTRGRVCLGWLAVTFVRGVEIDSMMRAYLATDGALDAAEQVVTACGPVLPITGCWGDLRVSPGITPQTIAEPSEWADAAQSVVDLHDALHGLTQERGPG